MATIPEIAGAIRTVLADVAASAARQTGFVKRASKLDGPAFAQCMVFGVLGNPQPTLDGLAQKAAALGVEITPQGLDDRFSPEAAAFLEQLLNAAVTQVVSAEPVAIPLLGRFNGVILQDSSIIKLPDTLSEQWRGCGDSAGTHTAALKIQVRLDVLTGTLYGPLLEDGRTQDRAGSIQNVPVPRGALRIADLGYFSLDRLREMADQGGLFLSRLQAGTAVFDEGEGRVGLLALLKSSCPDRLEARVRIGAKHRLPVRLLAARVPQEVADQRRRRMRDEARRRGQPVTRDRLALADWTILVTNAPAEMLALAEALVLARVRWQIELLFKLWKSHGRIDEWRSTKPWRILCELYAKLIAMIVQHWLLLSASWAYPNRSLVKAAQSVRDHGLMLLYALSGLIDLDLVIGQIGCCLAAGCRMNPRKRAPNTYQLLLDPVPPPHQLISGSPPKPNRSFLNLKELA
jgi:hypothetical protein